MRKLAFWLLPLAAGVVAAHAAVPAPADTANVLSSVDYNFVAQANLGAPFQIDSGRIAEQKGVTPAVRDYAHLMVVSHVPVVDALNKVLQRKGLTAPPNPLLHGAYDALLNSLKAEQGAHSTVTMWTGKSSTNKETLRCSATRSRTAQIPISRSSHARPCRRLRTIYKEP